MCKPLTSTGPHTRARACRAYTFAVINWPKRLSAASQTTLPGFQELHHSEPRVQEHPGPGCLLLDEKYQLGSGRREPCVSGQQDWLCLGAGSILLPVPGFLMRGRAAGKFPFLFFPLPLGPWKSRLSLSTCKTSARALRLYFGFNRLIGSILMQVSEQVG